MKNVGRSIKMLITKMLVPKMLQHFVKCLRKNPRNIEEKMLEYLI
jgi:hypothetical protein